MAAMKPLLSKAAAFIMLVKSDYTCSLQAKYLQKCKNRLANKFILHIVKKVLDFAFTICYYNIRKSKEHKTLTYKGDKDHEQRKHY